MEKYKYTGVHIEFDVKGEKHHLISDELFNGELLINYYEGIADQFNIDEEKIKSIKDGFLWDLNLMSKEIKEQLEKRTIDNDVCLYIIKSIDYNIKKLEDLTLKNNSKEKDIK